MATPETQILNTIFPDVPRENPATDKDGNFTALWELYFGALTQALQENFKNEGIVFPPLSAANMQTIQNLYTSYIGGTYENLINNISDITGQTLIDDDSVTANQFIIATDNSVPPLVTLAEWVPLCYMLSNPGNPNGSVAGVLNWLCYDTTNKILYICTTAGNTTNAVWTAV